MQESDLEGMVLGIKPRALQLPGKQSTIMTSLAPEADFKNKTKQNPKTKTKPNNNNKNSHANQTLGNPCFGSSEAHSSCCGCNQTSVESK
jgi:hypothetical protein